MLLSSSQSFSVNKSTFANNNGVLFQLQDGIGELSNSIIQTNGHNILYFTHNSSQSFSSRYSLIDFSQGGGWGQTNQSEEYIIYGDPLFLNPSNNDYHLQWGSQAIDAADPLVPPDPDGTIADIGA